VIDMRRAPRARGGIPWAPVIQAILLVLVVAVPIAEITILGGDWGRQAWLQCDGGLASPVPASFCIDAVLLIPSFFAMWHTVAWLGAVAAARPRQWRGRVAALGGAVSIVMFVGAVVWCLGLGWLGVILACWHLS
jgi:hypothetical protein